MLKADPAVPGGPDRNFAAAACPLWFQTPPAAGNAIGCKSSIQAQHAQRLSLQLTALDNSTSIEEMDIPEFKLHPPKGRDKGRCSIWVSGNWRITFELREGHAYVLNYEDYH